MYESFFGLREKPFTLNPDPDYLYLSETHEDVYTHLEYAVQEHHGFVVITGEIGAGKTTLIHHLLRKVERTVRMGVVNNTSIAPEQFLGLVCAEFGLAAPASDKAAALAALHRFLLERHAKAERVVLIVDEAQNLSDETLEELRLLSNLQSEKHFLLQVILAGQPELRLRLRRKSLEQLRQRVTVQCHLTGLRLEEVPRYVRHRLTVAGAADPDLFDEGALEVLARFSGGIPRLINVACDGALLAAFAEGRRTVDRAIVEEVAAAWQAGGTLEAPAARGGADTQDPGSIGAAALAALEERLAIVESRQQTVSEAVASLSERLAKTQERIALLVKQLRRAKDLMDERPTGPGPKEATRPPPPRQERQRGFFHRLWSRL